MKRGTNLPALGGYNQALVLELIRRAPAGISRIELAAQTGLSAQTLSNVARRLLQDGLVREAGKSGSGPGKPRTILQLEPDARFAIGLHIDPTVTTCVVLDLEGRTVAHARTRTPRGIRPEETIARLSASVAAIIETSGVDRERVLGVGIAFPGPLDAEQGRIFDPPLLEEWHDVPLGESLSASTGLPVHVEKDVTAAMVAETWISTHDVGANGLLFYYGTGVGAGLVVEGAVVRGASSNAGDIGHLIVDPDGPLCRCGRRGCLGDSIAPSALVAEAVERGILPPLRDGLDPSSVDAGFSRLLEQADAGDADAASIVGVAAQRIARGVLGITGLLDLDHVIFGGPFWERAAGAILPVVATALAEDPASMLTHRVQLRSSRLGEDIAAIGAACVVLDRAMTPATASLLIET
ncbi:ROK family transcriptional regulator [Rathayibacter sp. Leaf248]|uniref:ROK family transcriptional regulator n=1 Tax=Rathayibacter sp. Leaf248 TaxID=2876555 RepID=UPI001E50E1AF|nr:ROK family transcriptional regulator [Rathayibacter sp. Leaf248]